LQPIAVVVTDRNFDIFPEVLKYTGGTFAGCRTLQLSVSHGRVILTYLRVCV